MVSFSQRDVVNDVMMKRENVLCDVVNDVAKELGFGVVVVRQEFLERRWGGSVSVDYY